MNADSPAPSVGHNVAAQRFELLADGHAAFASYTREGDSVVFDHTFVPDAFRGKGVAALVVRAALEEARRQHWRIIPRCSYVAAYIEKNPEYADLVDRSR